ncbi:MAG: hypothetical protein L0H59_17755, partial [Tomitella sp.]|nr:hypothetical protein [Tomitella sp.]
AHGTLRYYDPIGLPLRSTRFHHWLIPVVFADEAALDAPLSPPDLSDKPEPATGRSGTYPGGTSTRWSDPAFRTHHGDDGTDRPPRIQHMR